MVCINGMCVFLGRSSVTSKILKLVCDLPMIWASQELCKGEAMGHIFSEILLYFLSQFLKIMQENYLESLIGMSSQAKLVLQPVFVRLFSKFYVKINTSQPKLSVANMSIKIPQDT